MDGGLDWPKLKTQKMDYFPTVQRITDSQIGLDRKGP